jgi:hypothetical protein
LSGLVCGTSSLLVLGSVPLAGTSLGSTLGRSRLRFGCLTMAFRAALLLRWTLLLLWLLGHRDSRKGQATAYK